MNAREIAQTIKDPELAALFAKCMDTGLARDRAREEAGLPPLEAYQPKKAYVPPKLNVLGQVDERPKTPPPASFKRDDDGLLADVTWLQLTLGNIKALRGMHFSWGALQGYTRGQWRQAIGALIGTAPGRIQAPKSFVMGTLKRIKEEGGQDPRARPGYIAMATWGADALRFAGIVI